MEKLFGLLAALLSESLVVIGKTLSKLGVGEEILAWANSEEGRQALTKMTEQFVAEYREAETKFLKLISGDKRIFIGDKEVQVFEVVKDANFEQLFASTDRNLDDLCFTRVEIDTFGRNHRNWLHPIGYATFFLTTFSGVFFVDDISVNGVGLKRHSDRLLDNSILWRASNHFRIVLPYAMPSPEKGRGATDPGN